MTHFNTGDRIRVTKAPDFDKLLLGQTGTVTGHGRPAGSYYVSRGVETVPCVIFDGPRPESHPEGPWPMRAMLLPGDIELTEPRKMRIVFFGTPEFAVPSLNWINKHYNLVGIVTGPDRPSPSPVKKYASDYLIPLFQPEKLQDDKFLQDLFNLQADLFVVVAFRMMPAVLWKMPPRGTINLHASLLPHYRGAAPIQWAIINGEQKTGVTTFFLREQIDTGPIILQDEISISPLDNAGNVYRQLMTLGVDCLAQTIGMIEKGKVASQEQAAAENIKAAPKLFREHCLIDWHRPVAQVYDFIRGLNPSPAAHTFVNNKMLKIFGVRKSNVCGTPGELLVQDKKQLHFHCQDGSISVQECQWEAKKKMAIGEFLRGFRPKEKPCN